MKKELTIGILIGLIIGIFLTFLYFNNLNKNSEVYFCSIDIPEGCTAMVVPGQSCNFVIPTTQKDCEQSGGVWVKRISK